MSLPSSDAHYRITSRPGEAGILDFEAGKALYSDPNVSARPLDFVAPEAQGNRFPRWLNREAAIAEAVIEWF
jgi:hypothetical protein